MGKMAELTIRPDEIRDALARFVAEYEPTDVAREEVGTVIDCGDGIAHVEGLPSAMANELLEFENGVRGIALNLEAREIGVVILGEFSEIEEGQTVRRTGEVLSVPVGDAFLGRMVGALGEPLDGRGPIEDTTLRALEVQAPSGVQRQPVKEALATGTPARPRSRSTRSSTRRPTGRRATRRSRFAASTSPSARRARRSPASSRRWKRPGRWSTPPSSPRPRPTRRATSTSRLTPGPRSASSGCTMASTC